MINYLAQRMRGWSQFVKFMAPFVVLLVLTEALLYGLAAAGTALVTGVTMIAVLDAVAPVVTNALFLRAHSRSGVPMYCEGDRRTMPTAADWHRVVMVLLSCYTLAVVVFTLAGSAPFGIALETAALYVGGPTLSFVGFLALFDWLHFLGHRRHYRKEQVAVKAEREALEVEKRFWNVVRDYREPGSRGAA